MALTKGNVTEYLVTPGTISYTVSGHNQNTGANGYIFVTVSCPVTTVTGVSYGSVAMSLVQRNTTGYTTDWTVWQLASPPTGANNTVVTMGTANYNPCSTFITSFIDCVGAGNTSYNGTPNTVVTTSLSISSNSMLLGAVYGGNNTTAYIGLPQGTNRTLEYNHNVSNFTWGAVSPSLTSGTKTCEGGATASCIIMVTEIKEVVSTPTNTQGMLMMF
jgi:hypothetical protein